MDRVSNIFGAGGGPAAQASDALARAGGRLHRVQSVDALRGLALLLVIADHCLWELPQALDYVEVPAFYVCSGVVSRSEGGWREFLARRVKRLLLPWVLFTVLSVAVLTLLRGSDVLTELRVSQLEPLWFLKALFWAVMMLYAVDRLGRRLGVWAWWTCAGLAVAAASVVTAHQGGSHEWVLWTGVPQAVVALPWLMAGRLIARARGLKSRTWLTRAGIGLAAVAGGLLVLPEGEMQLHWCFTGGEAYWRVLAASVMLTGGALLMLSAGEGSRALAPAAYIGHGSRSLTIYGLHGIAVAVVLALAGAAGPVWWTPAAALALTLAASLPLTRSFPGLLGAKPRR